VAVAGGGAVGCMPWWRATAPGGGVGGRSGAGRGGGRCHKAPGGVGGRSGAGRGGGRCHKAAASGNGLGLTSRGRT
jgi:hypothetical protein